MSLRVTIACEVKEWKFRSRRETESEQGVRERKFTKYVVVDPKPGDLVTCRLKAG